MSFICWNSHIKKPKKQGKGTLSVALLFFQNDSNEMKEIVPNSLFSRKKLSYLNVFEIRWICISRVRLDWIHATFWIEIWQIPNIWNSKITVTSGFLEQFQLSEKIVCVDHMDNFLNSNKKIWQIFEIVTFIAKNVIQCQSSSN